MNTTHKVSIGGMAFVVDESAYNELKTYTDRLHRQFGHRADGQEIVADIESRIAELLMGKLLEPEQVVSLSDVKDVLLRIGDPAELDESSEGSKEQRSYSYSSSGTSSRRLYRSAESKVIGGVCGGLGAYFNIDPVLFRIAFVGLTLLGSAIVVGWFFPLVYIVLWISAPMALTVGQKLEMEGKKVNVSNIEQRIRQEAQNVSPHIRTAGESFLSVVGVIVKVFAIFFISMFVVAGLAASTVILLSIFGLSPDFMSSIVMIDNDADFAMFNVISYLFPHLFWFKVSVFALVFIPTVLMIMVIIKLLFKSRFRTRYIVIPLTVIWTVALFATLTLGVASLQKTFGSNSSVNSTIEAPAPVDTLTIAYAGMVKLAPTDLLITLKNNSWDDYDYTSVTDGKVHIGKHHRGWNHHHGFSVISGNDGREVRLTDQSQIFVRPVVNVEYCDDVEKPQVTIKKWSTGRSYSLATQSAEDIRFDAEFKGSSLLLTPAVPLQLGERILKGVEVTVLMPKGKAYRIDREVLTSFRSYDSKRENGVYTYDGSGSNHDFDVNVDDVDTVVVKATDKF